MNADRITLRPPASNVTIEELAEHGAAIACDFYIEGVEKTGIQTPWGWKLGAIDNVDHHAPDPNFERIVSSTNLAILKAAAPSMVRVCRLL
ncbi:MAG: hypothetical protein ACREK8_10135 [Gemmatimonadales bacterium]